MLQEIKSFLELIKTDSTANRKKRLLFSALILFVLLLVFNLLVLNTFISDDVIVRFQQSKLLFLNNLSPYDEDVQNYLKDQAKQQSLNTSADIFDFESGLPGLIIYLPFSFVTNIVWAVSLFSTFILFSYIVAIYLLFRALNFELHRFDSTLLFCLSLLNLHMIKPFLEGITNTLFLLVLVAAIILFLQNKNLLSGVLLGFISFNIVTFPVVLFIILIGLLRTKKISVLVWAFISGTLTTLTMMIFDRDWLIGWLRNLYLAPQRVPFLTYPQALTIKYEFPASQLFTIIPLILIIWLIFEVWQNPFNSSSSWFWIIGLGSILNYYLILQKSDISAIMMIISQTIIISIWRNRIKKSHYLIVTLFLALNTLLFSALYFLPIPLQKDALFDFYMLGSSIFQIFNGYWLKRWAVIPYEFENIGWNN